MDSLKKVTRLNEKQQSAVTHTGGPLLVIAGAGTGKTTVITERIKHLISSGQSKPEEILALTFTEKASREMEERVDIAMPYGVSDMWISTFHAFCDRVLRSEGINIGIDPGFTLMTEAETISFFRSRLFSLPLTYYRPLGNPTKFLQAMLTLFNRLRDEDVRPDEYHTYARSLTDKAATDEEKAEAERNTELSLAFRAYEEAKVKDSVCDYADLISLTLKLFRTRPNILKAYRSKFKFILVDEFQDTNYAQNEMALMLSLQGDNITVVGDDDQAIYRFRGAAISNVLEFRKRYPHSKVIVLTENYRSSKEILDRSYQLIQHNNPDRLEVTENITKNLESMRRVRGKKIKALVTDRVENEAALVASEIRTLTEGDHPEFEFSDVAILVRANSHADPFMRALSREGIPYQFLGPGQLFRQPEVKDVIAYLKLLGNPGDSVACYRVLSMDHFAIPPRDIAVMFSFARDMGLTLFEVMERVGEEEAKTDAVPVARPRLTADGEGKVKTLIAMMNRHLGLVKKETAGQILYFFLTDSGLINQFTSFEKASDEKRADNIARFFNKLKTYESDHDDAGVHAVCDWIDLSMDLGESPAATDTDWTKNNAVNILTVHSAKGLEFKAVFLVNLVSERFPTRARQNEIPVPDALVKEVLPAGDHHIQEERRLFYVGMTRARDLLYFSGAKFYGEGKRTKKLSPFIREALEEEEFVHIAETAPVRTIQMSLLEWEKKKEPAIARPAQMLKNVSYSRLETFNICPLQYKYRYILRIPVPPSAALIFGDTIHRTVRNFYEEVRRGDRPDAARLLKLYRGAWNSSGFKNASYESKMKQHGEMLLMGFYEKGYVPGAVPKDLEKPFRIRITPDVTLTGKIDRVDEREDGIVEIIDYKTGKAPKKKDVSKDRQLTVYALAAGDKGLYGKPPEKVIVSFYFFEGQEKISGTRTREDLETQKAEIAKQVAEMRTSDFPAKPGFQCDFCEFRLICEAWK